MTLTTLLGRAMVALVAPLAGYLASRYHQPELGTILVGGIAAIGGELLLRQSPPGTVSLPRNAGISGGSLLVLLLALPFLQGCALFQRPGVQKVVKCTGDVLAVCRADLVPLLACLDVSNPTACVLAVGEAAGCAGKEALACRVREAAEPSLRMALVSLTEDEQRRQDAAKRVYTELGVRPEAP